MFTVEHLRTNKWVLSVYKNETD